MNELFLLQIGRTDEFDYMIIPKGLQVKPEFISGPNQTHCRIKVEDPDCVPPEWLNKKYLCPKAVKQYFQRMLEEAITESPAFKANRRRIKFCK